MTLSNDRIILDQILVQRQQALAPTLTPYEYFEIFSAEQIWLFRTSRDGAHI